MVNLCTEHFLEMSYGTHTKIISVNLISGIGRLIFINGSNVMDM